MVHTDASPTTIQSSNVHDHNNDIISADDITISSSSTTTTYKLVVGWTCIKLAIAMTLCYSAYTTHDYYFQAASTPSTQHHQQRRLLQESADQQSSSKRDNNNNDVPSYMVDLMHDLQSRHALFDNTPPQEIKYWFEYSGKLQKYFYRFSKSRGKADYFEGRDDSGVVSARFVEEFGGTEEYRNFYLNTKDPHRTIPNAELSAYMRLLENCWSMGAPSRPNVNVGTWDQWYSKPNISGTRDRCRILLVVNTVGVGRGTTMLWETNPPMAYAELPPPWISEQETAVTHLQRNLQEINTMCQTGYFAARVQIMVCEPIPAKWTEWMDSQLPDCGGKIMDPNSLVDTPDVEDRPSPVQIVVAATAETADTCHDLKSGFMEKRIQDLVLAPPYIQDNDSTSQKKYDDPTIKTTNPDLFSSDQHDLYVAMKWSSLVTIRAVHAFLQASADIAAGATSLTNQKNSDAFLMSGGGPSNPFLIPSFVRVSYVSEENNKVAKWRMHGDFFHPAAWEICKDSFDMTFIPYSLSGSGGVNSICTENSSSTTPKMDGSIASAPDGECGQWWIYFTELQMPTSPEVFANEISSPIVQGGSNFFWMITDRQRREIVKGLICHYTAQNDGNQKENSCPDLPQAVIPLGDMESFLINFTPNTALGRQHIEGRRPGYSNEEERKQDRQRVKDRKQLNDQEDIEKALFDYTIYPAALFHKDATLKAARARDVVVTKQRQLVVDPQTAIGPQSIKSEYYDVTITKPRPPVLGWCQAISRHGLCTLYADYFRLGSDTRCFEACGFKKDWSSI